MKIIYLYFYVYTYQKYNISRIYAPQTTVYYTLNTIQITNYTTV